jgi:hypothetical protein
VYAAYGGVFIALALVWGVVVDGFRTDHWDMLGAAICVAGVVVIVGAVNAAPLAAIHAKSSLGHARRFARVRPPQDLGSSGSRTLDKRGRLRDYDIPSGGILGEREKGTDRPRCPGRSS